MAIRNLATLRSWAIAGAILTLPAIARAQDDPRPYPPCDRAPTEADTAAAKGAFQAGNGSFNEADYKLAITYWEDAYRRDCTAHPLLLNLARAYELNGQKRHAVNALQTLLQRNPGSPDEAQIRRRIEKMEEQLRAEAGSAPPPPGPAAAPPPPAGEQPAPPPPPPEVDSGGSRPIWPLFIAGGGVLVAGVGTVVWLGALSDISAAEDDCPTRKNCDPKVADDANSARSRALVGGIVTGVGGAAVVGGLVLYFLSEPEGSASAAPQTFVARVTPAVAPGYGGLSLGGSF